MKCSVDYPLSVSVYKICKYFDYQNPVSSWLMIFFQTIYANGKCVNLIQLIIPRNIYIYYKQS